MHICPQASMYTSFSVEPYSICLLEGEEGGGVITVTLTITNM